MPDTKQSSQATWTDIFDWKAGIALLAGFLLIALSNSYEPGTFKHGFTHEGGLALIVAVFVWVLFELASRRKQEQRIDQRIEHITRNVFFGVLRKELPEGLIDETTLLVLGADVIRRGFTVTYTLSDDTYELNGNEIQYVKLRAVTQFTLKNISVNTATVKIGVGLPNPIQPALRAKEDVTSITIRKGDGIEQCLELQAAKVKMRQDMQNDKNYIAYCYADENYKLLPNEEVMVCADYVMAKETEDTEVLQSLFPADGLRVTIIDRAPEKRVVRARSIHRARLKDWSSPAEPSSHIYTLEHHLLPHQGVSLWWKARPPNIPIEANQGTDVQHD